MRLSKQIIYYEIMHLFQDFFYFCHIEINIFIDL